MPDFVFFDECRDPNFPSKGKKKPRSKVRGRCPGKVSHTFSDKEYRKRRKASLGLEKLVSSAIRYRGKIYVGKRHSNCFDEIEKDLGFLIVRGETQGFLTDRGKFVTRRHARLIAEANGQYLNLKHCGPKMIFSENLW